MTALVLDTNIVLDLFVFDEPAAAPLRADLAAGAAEWLASAAMRDELSRVLGYPQVARRLAFHGRAADTVLAAFDRHARLVPDARKAPFTCKDPDDQRFIDLAVAHGCALLSKDHAVLCMARRLATLSVRVQTLHAWSQQALAAA